jgi:hypothetical protein
MQDIRTVAIDELSRHTIDPFVKLDACRKYDIDANWALDAFVHICTRETKMTRKEGLRLGAAFMVVVANAREELAVKKLGLSHSTFTNGYCSQCDRSSSRNYQYCRYCNPNGVAPALDASAIEAIVKETIIRYQREA